MDNPEHGTQHWQAEFKKCRESQEEFGRVLGDVCERLRLVESRAGSTEGNFNAFAKYFHDRFEPTLMQKIDDMHDTVSFVADNRAKVNGFVSVSKGIGSVVVWSMKWSLIVGGWFAGMSIMWHAMINRLIHDYPWLSKWRLW